MNTGTIKLTADEQAMLRGEGGEALRRALELQLAVGEFYGARRLVPCPTHT